MIEILGPRIFNTLLLALYAFGMVPDGYSRDDPVQIGTGPFELVSFTPGVEGPACDAAGNVYAVNFARQQTIGRVTPRGEAEVFVTLPGESVGKETRGTGPGRGGWLTGWS